MEKFWATRPGTRRSAMKAVLGGKIDIAAIEAAADGK